MANATPVTHQPISANRPMTEGERNNLLTDWKAAKENLEAAKEAEIELRNKIVENGGLFDPDKVEGTQTVELGAGWKIKAVKKLNWKVSVDCNGNQIEDALVSIESSAGKLAADELIKFDPRLSVSTYKKLTDEEKKVIDPFLQSSQATPSLVLVPPKK